VKEKDDWLSWIPAASPRLPGSARLSGVEGEVLIKTGVILLLMRLTLEAHLDTKITAPLPP
jgi:hypothetical protein